MTSPRTAKFSEVGKVRPAMLIAEMKKHNRLPKYQIPKSVILYYGNQSSPKWEQKLEAKSFFGARFDLAVATQFGVLSGFGMGAPATAFYVEMLTAFGVKNIISLGQAGSLKSDIQLGEVVLATKALRDEGTSSHYLPPAEFSFTSQKCHAHVAQLLSKSKIAIKEGDVWSTDALFRETDKEIQQYAQQGIVAVDMETSALFAMGHYLKVHVASALVISDVLWAEQWHSDFAGARLKMQAVAEAIIASRCEL